MKKITLLSISSLMISVAVYAQNNTPTQQPTTQPQVQAVKMENKAEATKPAEVKKETKKEVKKAEYVKAEVVNINNEKNEVTLKIKKEEKVFPLDPKEIAKLKVGENVKVKLMDGKIEEIKEVKKNEHKKMEMKKEEKKAETKPAETKPAETKPAGK
ncbi:MAG: hypothetical protein ACP5SD_06510 [Elusimicrobiales bacterium]|nr:hypothetical protein [Elusimicrobiales bacterium]HOJ85774.1 hypothetical protein [Elusimicrobiales bacterium]HPO94531.1 hypothetical protein [Elusimicrobiales bacterium]